MLDSFDAACLALGRRHIHMERFEAAKDVDVMQDICHEVELSRSEQFLTVAAGKSLLDAGVNADYSCREGVCRACETAVLGGIPDHRDSVLNERERASSKTMMVDVSGCIGERLVLDL